MEPLVCIEQVIGLVSKLRAYQNFPTLALKLAFIFHLRRLDVIVYRFFFVFMLGSVYVSLNILVLCSMFL